MGSVRTYVRDGGVRLARENRRFSHMVARGRYAHAVLARLCLDRLPLPPVVDTDMSKCDGGGTTLAMGARTNCAAVE